jgi:nanoRNase/pAp phosphatase (c-di-AMP/oligoRNAs hydrolase)
MDHHPSSTNDVKGNREFKNGRVNYNHLAEMIKERNLSITPDEATVMLLGI